MRLWEECLYRITQNGGCYSSFIKRGWPCMLTNYCTVSGTYKLLVLQLMQNKT